ncbi:MAG TPA: hypothetical protein DGB32_10455, partial [Dehalococcoidia bacterium]|nr:hypothetical protein [Dehalococcoidia bacterium]
MPRRTKSATQSSTLGELRASGYRRRSLRDKIPANLSARIAAGVPIRMSVEDFEVAEVEHSTDATTVLMLDQKLDVSLRSLGRRQA